MTEKKRTVLLSILVCLLIVTLMTFSLTRARYSEEIEAGGDFSGNLEYTVSEQVEISSMDDFFAAIENGYSNIKISEEAENPLVITGGVSDVNSDLIIDLNGHELQRNNREPMLNVTSGIRLTIIDTSAAQTGCFYNPVGSVLEISGGTLTVSAGIFESGPRSGESMAAEDGAAVYGSEYASGNGTNWGTNDVAGSFTQTENGTLYVRDTVSGSYGEGNEATRLPLIIPHVVSTSLSSEGETLVNVNGNMYFDRGTNISLASAGSTNYITADTYLYFVIDAPNVTNTRVSAGSADFYYEYTLYQTITGEGDTAQVSYSTTGTGAQNETPVSVTVYGYNKVKVTQGEDYSAIEMHSGNLYVRGGSYTSYFGTEDTYCVYASGGYMAVESGVGSFEAHGDGVCVSISYPDGTDQQEDYLRVSAGSFYSQQGNIVEVSGGRMEVSGSAAFTKEAEGSGSAAGDNGAAIAISGGTLNVAGTAAQPIEFNMSGSYMNGILSSASGAEGTVMVTNTRFTFDGGTFNYGINSAAGTVTANGCVFILPGENSRGISIARGIVNVGGAGGEASADGLDTATYSYFYLDSSVGCYGVYADNASGTGGTSSTATVNMTAAQIFVGQGNGAEGSASYGQLSGAGIYMNAVNNSSVNLGNVLVIAAGNSVSGVYVENGSIAQTAGKLVVVTGAKASGYAAGTSQFRDIESYGTDANGITDLSGRIAVQGNSYTYGVYSAGGTVALQNVYAAVYGNYAAGILVDARDASGNVSGTAGGVTVSGSLAMRVVGGSLTLDGYTVSSAAGISTEGGDITLNKGADIFVSNGLGITARAGTVTFAGGTDTAMNTVNITTPQSTGIYVNNGGLNIGSEENGNIIANIVSTIGTNYRWATAPSGTSDGGMATIENQYDGVYVQGGSLYAYGTFNVTHTGVATDNITVTSTADGDQLYRTFEIKSYAVRVESGSAESTEESGSAESTEVTILKGNIVNEIGGGVYVSDGKVTLGNSDSAVDDISVNTNGKTVHENSWSWNYGTYIPTSSGGNWNYKLPATGGHAVVVSSGTLTVWNGRYTAHQGDGIRVSSGTVNIYNGVFNGNDEGYTDRDSNDDRLAGPAASYAFKLYGGTVNIYNGTYGNPSGDHHSGSGAFIMGTSAEQGYANIYGGTFEVNGQAGFGLYDYGNLLFEPRDGAEISVAGIAAAIAVENRNVYTKLEIKGGTFNSTRPANGDGSAIWYSNTNSSSQLIISGGTFTGSLISGLYLASTNADIQLSGGIFYGAQGGISGSNSNTRYSALLADGYNAYSNSAMTQNISNNQIGRASSVYIG